MKKIIVKCKVKNRDRLEKNLEDVGLDFSPVYWHHDRVYVPRGYKGRSNYPRLIMRTEMHAIDEAPTYLLSLRRHIEDSGIDIIEDCPITDYQGMVNVILQLGFKAYGEISRRRQEIKMTENTMFYLDILDENDTIYAKLETVLKEHDSAEQVKLELINTLRSFGETDVIESTYFEL
ncbi:hypothetical protein IJI18_01485 [Candidatus Saccharibacteria bacterium]|nr:hypothetical protein [Candidatus Saccharibacteria bacterium]